MAQVYSINNGILEKYEGDEKNLIIPEGVTEIAANVFSSNWDISSNVWMIESVEFPKSLRLIREGAFYKCKNLHAVFFQEGLVEIGANSFEETALFQIDLPDSLKVIGHGAFNRAIKVSVIRLPKGLEKVESFAFGSAKEVVVYDNAPFALKVESHTVTVIDEKTEQIKYKVWNCRWSECEKIWEMFSSVWLPNAEFDFEVLDDSFKNYKDTINRIITAVYRLEYPYKLSGDSVKMYQAFLNRNAYKLLGQKIEEKDIEWIRLLIKYGALKTNNYEQFTESARKTGDTEIVALFLAWANDHPEISKKKAGMKLDDKPLVLWKINTSKSDLITRYMGREPVVQFPDKCNGTKITGIADVTGETPDNYKEIREIIIPEGYTTIGKNAFKDCEKLEKVVLPKSLISLGNHCFENCVSLKEIRLPEFITAIGDNAFAGCKKLSSVIFPKELVRLGSNAFKGCNSLHEIELNEKLEVLGPQCFYETPLIKVVYRGKGCYCPEKMCFSYPRYVYTDGKINALGIPEATQMPMSYLEFQVEDIAKNSDKELLKGLTICSLGQLKAFPKNVKYFRGMEFSEFVTTLGGTYSARLTKNTDILVAYTIASSDASIERAIEQGTNVITELQFLKMIKEGEVIAARNSMNNEKSPEKKKSADKNDPYRPSEIRKSWKYQETEEGTIELTLYKGKDTEVYVPERVGDLPVEAIGANAFFALNYAFGGIDKKSRDQHRTITKIILPNGIKRIGAGAFFYCENLKSIEIPDSLEEIQESAFSGCRNLSGVQIPEKAVLGKRVFTDCNSMADEDGFIIYRCILYGYKGKKKDIEMPNGIKEIQCSHLGLEFNSKASFGAMQYTPAVKSVNLPESLEYIDDDAFNDLKSLKTIKFPAHPLSFGKSVFKGCDGLKDENGCIVVQKTLFDFCSDSKEAFLPESLEKIDVGAFFFKQVTKIHIPESVTDIAANAFTEEDLRRLKTVYGKEGSIAEEFAIKNNKKFETE